MRERPPLARHAAPRYAIYWAPSPAHALWPLGCAWLGRDARAGREPGAPARTHVAAPWRYGFHATLKAPMALRDGVLESDLLAAVHRVAARHRPFPLPTLRVGLLHDFVALRPQEEIPAGHPLRDLADACVVRLDDFRAAPSAAERARRSTAGLGARQRDQVERFGYAHVLDDWRFHITLSDPLPGAADPPRPPSPPTRAGEAGGPGATVTGHADGDPHGARLDGRADVRHAMRQAAERHFAPALGLPLTCDALCVFVEPAHGAPLEWRHRVMLGDR